MFLHDFITFWLLGSILVSLDIYFTIKDDPNVNYRYNMMTTNEKLVIFIQLFVLCGVGSWFIIIWRIVNYILKTYLHKRRK